MRKKPTHISPTYAITEAGALLLLGKDRRILILAPRTSKNKASTSVDLRMTFPPVVVRHIGISKTNIVIVIET